MQRRLRTEALEIASYLMRCNATKIYSFWHITLARFLQLNPLPPSMSVVHIAAQAASPLPTLHTEAAPPPPCHKDLASPLKLWLMRDAAKMAPVT